jgi:hypothetical protein
MKQPKGCWIGGVVVLIVLAAFPWLIANLYAPLRPPVFEETATMYFVTESALFTREAERELNATSIMITLPPEDLEPMPGDPDYTPPPSRDPGASSHDSEVVLVQMQTTRVPLTGSSALPLERYSCPSPSAQINGQFPPNQVFVVLGWNVDLDNVTYLLIEDEPAKRQVWLRIPDLTVVRMSDNYLNTPAITCRTYVAETPTFGLVTATPDGIDVPATSVTSSVPLPRIATVTLPPPVQRLIEITEAEAVQQIKESVPELKDPEIELSPEGAIIRGSLDLPGPLGTTIVGAVLINTELVQVDGELQAAVSLITVAGRDITGTEDGKVVESAINAWLKGLLIRRDLRAFELRDGVLLLDVLERQFSEFPELSQATADALTETARPTQTFTPTWTPSITNTLVVRTITPTSPVTPLPMWTQTPSPTRDASTGG